MWGSRHLTGQGRDGIQVYENRVLSDGMRRPVSTGCDKLPMIDVLKAQRKGDRQCRRLALDRAGDSLQSQRVSVGQFTNFRFGRILVRLRLNR